MYSLYLFIVALICYAILIGIVIYTIGIYKKAKDLNPYNETLSQLKADIRTASSIKEELKANNENLRNEAGRYQGIIDNGKAAKEFLDKVSGSVESANARIEYLKNRLDEANKALSEVEDKINKKNEELVKAKNDENEAIIKKEAALNYCNQLEIKSSDLEAKINSLKEDINQLSPQKAKLEAELEGLRKQIENAKEELRKLHEEIIRKRQEAEEEIQKIQEAKNRKEQEIREELQTVREEKARKEQEVSNADDKLATLKADIASAKEELAGVKTQVENTIGGEKIWGELDVPVITNPKFAKPNKDVEGKALDEIRELNNFAAKLDECNIRFDVRTINAFHTSLKTADSSPLVVLAGISGTGKSLLPQLYAKFFGFNFLNMAVQPRWDSSQDLFGFYNYAQFRYKATELSRLLWQYDIYNNLSSEFRSVKGKVEDEEALKAMLAKDKGRLPMNIVLLDEMNLARVEYYFSDMLSKLETRRTINELKPDERYMAEVEIECGTGAVGRRLFVGNNTLFVGTMNEDETTQALSDKIMDRANVLRFGCPKDLQANGDSVKFSSMCNEKEPTTLEMWKKLQTNSIPNQLSDTLEKRVKEINELMLRLERPFGHRVKMAIVNYVSNYPGVGVVNSSFDNALADQIEFKIMPKLNGVEKTDPNNLKHLQNLGKFIRPIDKELSDAFDKVLNDSSSFFSWPGVRR